MARKHGRLLAALLAVPLAANATGFDLVAGPSATSSGRTTAAVFASAFGTAADDGRVYVEPIGTLGGIDSRSSSRHDLDRQVFLAGGGVRILAANRHWFVSEQIVATSARTDALSSRFEFMTSVGWERGRFIAQLRHISNAHLLGGGENLGETMLLAGVRF
jgi:hypothetical protein